MEAALKYQIAYERHRTLKKVKTDLEDLHEPYLSPEDLNDMKISLSSHDLFDENDLDFETRFCQPFPAEAFDRAYEKCSFFEASINMMFLNRVLPWIVKYGDLDGKTGWVGRLDYTSYPILSSYDYEKLQERSWEAYHIRHALPLPRKPQDSHQEKAKLGDRYTRSFLGEEVHDVFRPGPAKPHIAFSIANSWNADDGKLFRTEILAAVKMMIRHLWHKATWDYFVHPVFIYSFTRSQARILQVHLDYTNDTIFVRMSPWVAIDCQTKVEDWKDQGAFQQNEERIKLIMRWMTNIPIGHTSCDSLLREDNHNQPVSD